MDQVQGLLERPKLYGNVDGVDELGIRFMCLGYALLSWLQSHASRHSAWHQMSTFGVYVGVMVLIIHYGSKAIKNRITYRRTGYIEYHAGDKYWLPLGLGASVSALLGAGLYLAVRRHWEISVPGSLFGLVFCAGYLRLASVVRLKWVIFWVMVAGVLAIATLPADLVEGFTNHTGLTPALPARVLGAYWLTFVVCGAVMMVSGGISFWLYLGHTKASVQDAP